MNEKTLNKHYPSNRIIIDRLKEEGMPLISEIENNLMINDPNEKTIKKLNKSYNKSNELRNQNRVNYSEAMKFIHKFNKNMKKNIELYNKTKKDNIIFSHSFNKLKKINKKKLPSIKQDKINYIFCGLFNQYDKKGFQITMNDLNGDIYKENGLLIGNSGLNKFYKYYFVTNKNEKNKKVEKNINFLSKINKQTQILYNNKLLERKYLEENEKYIFFNDSNKDQFITQKQEENKEENKAVNKPEPKEKRKNLFNFKKNIIIREITEEKTEIKKLQKLISEEEKQIMIQRRKIREQNKKFMNRINDSTSFERNPKGKRTKTINPTISYHFRKKDKNEINIDKTYINDDKNKNKLISEESNINFNINNENNYINNTSLQSNNLKNINSVQSENTNLSNNFNFDSKNKRFLYSIFRQFSLSNIIKKRLSTINILNFNNSNSTNSTNSFFINLQKKRRSSVIVPTMKRTLTVIDTYEKISNLDFISLEKDSDKKREKVTKLLKKFYGKNYQDFNKKNNHINILRNYERMKEEIIKSENKNALVKYKNELPELMQNKIEHNLEQNEKLKNYGNDFIISFYDKKLND